jgi:hypothetical protein
MKWAKLTFTGKGTRYITKLLKTFYIRITFTTKRNIRHVLQDNHNNIRRNPCNESGVYQLTCAEKYPPYEIYHDVYSCDRLTCPLVCIHYSYTQQDGILKTKILIKSDTTVIGLQTPMLRLR